MNISRYLIVLAILLFFNTPSYCYNGDDPPPDYSVPTPLYDAVISGDIGWTQRLLRSGVNPDDSGKPGWTPLLFAAYKGNADIATILIEYGADVNFTCGRMYKNPNDFDMPGGNTALHLAAFAQKKNPELISALIAGGADVNTRNLAGKTPLHMAVYRRTPPRAGDNEYIEVCKLLIDNGAEINAKSNKNSTPFDISIFYKSPGVARYLLSRGAGSTLSNIGKYTLHSAAGLGYIDLCKVILSRGADINSKTRTGDRPLHFAVRENQLETVKFLLANNADIEAAGEDDETPLHESALLKDTGMAGLLLSEGADITAVDCYGRTPLHKAAAFENTIMVLYFLDNGIDVDISSNSGQTPLHRAAEGNYKLDTIDALLNNGADINAIDYDGHTPLDLAYRNTRIDYIVEFLISKGGKVNNRSSGMREQGNKSRSESRYIVPQPSTRTDWSGAGVVNLKEYYINKFNPPIKDEVVVTPIPSDQPDRPPVKELGPGRIAEGGRVLSAEESKELREKYGWPEPENTYDPNWRPSEDEMMRAREEQWGPDDLNSPAE